jgi:hypothetical protein
MLNFYINRAGKHILPEQRIILEVTKAELACSTVAKGEASKNIPDQKSKDKTMLINTAQPAKSLRETPGNRLLGYPAHNGRWRP